MANVDPGRSDIDVLTAIGQAKSASAVIGCRHGDHLRIRRWIHRLCHRPAIARRRNRQDTALSHTRQRGLKQSVGRARQTDVNHGHLLRD